MVSFSERQDYLLVSESIGRVSCVLTVPRNPVATLVLAHGAGAGMRHPFMQRIAEELAILKIAIIRYNFPFIENKKKRPDAPAVTMTTVKAAIDFAALQLPELAMVAGGKSFGGRMTSQFVAQHAPERVKGIAFFGFPLHPPGKPGVDRAAHLQHVQIPTLFLQGTKDALAEIELMEQVCNNLSMATLIKFKGADHSFKVPKHDLLPVLASTTAKWISTILL